MGKVRAESRAGTFNGIPRMIGLRSQQGILWNPLIAMHPLLMIYS